MSHNKLICSALSILPQTDEMNRFVNVGEIKNSNRIFECGTIVNGIPEINAYINADGTCSFVNSEATTFTGLADVPHSYADRKNNVVTVGDDENCLRFSSKLDVDEIKTNTLKTGEIFAQKFQIDGETNLGELKVSRLTQIGSALNEFFSPIKATMAEINNLFSNEIKSRHLSLSGDCEVNGDTKMGKLSCNGLFNSGHSILSEIKGTGASFDFAEIGGRLDVNSVEIATNLNVNGYSMQKQINSHSIVNTGEIATNDFSGLNGRFKTLITDEIGFKKMTCPSVLCFGTIDKPMIFLPNTDRYIDVLFEFDGQRAYGYGYAPTQALDTINISITGTDNSNLTKTKVKVDFQYYNLRNNAIPIVYPLGTIIYPIDDTTIGCKLKLSGNLPVSPFWILSIELIPL